MVGYRSGGLRFISVLSFVVVIALLTCSGSLTGSTGALAQAGAASTLPDSIINDLNRAAERGPRALLDRLEQILSQNPSLAASPTSAGALAREAGRPVAGFLGANVPVYRDIAVRIINASPPSARREVSRAVAIEIRRVATLDPTVREPLVGDVDALVAEARARAARVSAQRGITLGSFILYPEIQVSEYFDDNIFATKSSRVSDYVTVIGPHVFVVSDWSKHRLEVEAHTDIVRYASNENENSEDYWFATEGRYDFTDMTNVFGGALYGQFHEDRDSPEDVSGLEPTQYTETRAFAGISHTVGKITGRLGATWERSKFDDTPTATSTINNSDRDRDHITTGGKLTFRLNDTYSIYGEANGDFRKYRSAVDDNNFNRDSDGYKAVMGGDFRVSGTADGGAFIGFMRQNYDDPNLENISALAFGANIRWRVLQPTVLSAWASRSIEDTTLFASPGYILTGVGVVVEHEILGQLKATLRGSYYLSDFSGVARADDEYDASAGLRYDFSENFYIAADYRFQKRISTTSAVDYQRHQVFLRLGANF